MKPQEEFDDSRLVRLAKEGDMEAFETLVRRYQHQVYALCRHMTGDYPSADDLAQETFVKAYFSLARFDDRLPLYPWLRRIALNAALNYLRGKRREVPLEEGRPDAANPSWSRADPAQTTEDADLERKLQAGLACLPSDQRQVFILRHYEGLSYEEIAGALQMPLGTVMSRLSRARQKLKPLLAATLGRRA